MTVRHAHLPAGTLLVLLLLAAGSLPVPSPVLAQSRMPGVSGDPDNPITPLDRAHEFASLEGDFRVIFPSGCGSVTTRTLDQGTTGIDVFEEEYPLSVFCDRNGEMGEGCSVVVFFNGKTAEGDPAGPAEVMARMSSKLASYGARIVHQQPLQKDFGDGVLAEGLDVLAAQEGGSGQVWLRGFLIGSDIYIMSAWDLGGNVFNNPDYQTFFNSFQLGAE